MIYSDYFRGYDSIILFIYCYLIHTYNTIHMILWFYELKFNLLLYYCFVPEKMTTLFRIWIFMLFSIVFTFCEVENDFRFISYQGMYF